MVPRSLAKGLFVPLLETVEEGTGMKGENERGGGDGEEGERERKAGRGMEVKGRERQVWPG